MTPQEQYEVICQRVLRKHYKVYRKAVEDPFFVDSAAKAEVALNQMLRNAKEEAEAAIYINRRDINSRQIAEMILCKYLSIGRKYGKQYYRKRLKVGL